MLFSIAVSLIYREGESLQFLLSGGITTFAGLLFFLITRKAHLEVTKRDGYLIVTAGWLTFSLFGTLPFILTGAIPNFTDTFLKQFQDLQQQERQY